MTLQTDGRVSQYPLFFFEQHGDNNNSNNNNHNEDNNTDNVLSSQVLHFSNYSLRKKLKGVASLASPAETSFSEMEDVQRSPRYRP